MHHRWIRSLVAAALALPLVILAFGFGPLFVAAQDATATPTPSDPTSILAETPTPDSQARLRFPAFGFEVEVIPTGLQVTNVDAFGTAQTAGLRIGDRIISVSGITVNSATVREISRLLTNPTLRSYVFIIARGDRTLSLAVRNALAPTPTLRPTALPTQPPIGGGITGQRILLGVTYDVITPGLAQQRNLPETQGALVVAVTPNSPAAVAGIRPGDIIIAVNDEKVDVKRTLAYRMLPYAQGDEVTLTVVRGTERFEIRVTLVVQRGVAFLPGTNG